MRINSRLEVSGEKVQHVYHGEELEEQAALIAWVDKTVIDWIKIGDYVMQMFDQVDRGTRTSTV